MQPFAPPQTAGKDGGSSVLDQCLQLVKRTFDSLVRVVTNDKLVTQFVPTGSDVKVYHWLGRNPTSIDVVGINANANVWESTTANPDRNKVVLYRSSADVTIILRFV